MKKNNALDKNIGHYTVDHISHAFESKKEIPDTRNNTLREYPAQNIPVEDILTEDMIIQDIHRRFLFNKIMAWITLCIILLIGGYFSFKYII